MAKAEPAVEIEEAPVQPIQSRSKLLILLALSAVVLLQMIFLAIVLRGFSSPPPDEPQNSIRLPLEEPSQRLDLVEYPITDAFNCMVPSDDGTGGFTVMAKFTLKHENSKKKRFTTLYEKNKDKIRGEIVTILWSSKIEELSDPNRTRIKNRILQKINEIFAEPQPLVKEVIVVDFRSTPT